jgi:hypothetical protein
MEKSKWQLGPALTSKGAPWYQLCYYCGKMIDFIKDSKSNWKRVGGIDSKLVRHSKCYCQEPLK